MEEITVPDVRSRSCRIRLVVGLTLAVLAAAAPAARAADQPAISAPPDAIVGESDGFVDLAVRLSATSPDAVTVNYATANSGAGSLSACNGDYIGVAGTLSFAPGETSKTVRVAINDCEDVE